MTAADTHIIAFLEGAAGRLRLDRPRALHSLDPGMVRAMTASLLAWRNDDAVRIVMIDHAASPDGDPKRSRGFCAGGDVVTVAALAAQGATAASGFFFEEYRLNYLLYTYPKPAVAFMDGIVMGGGVGIACPCRYRVATERTVFAMPETTIGIFPDVGGGRYLSRLRGRLGQYLALTGARLDGAACKAFGLATHHLPSDVLDDAKARIAADPGRAEAILDDLSVEPPAAVLVERLAQIDRCFASDDLPTILAQLDGGDDWAQATAATIRAKSPTACAVSLRLLAQSPQQPDFADEMRLEYGLMVRMIAFPDFQEGVRALLIDKDNAPRWTPPADTDPFFEPLPPDDAWSPL